MELKLSADYVRLPGSDSPGEVAVKLNGDIVLILKPARRPGAGPGAEDDLITETVIDAMACLLDWQKGTNDPSALVVRMGMRPGQPLMPWPEASQDLAFIAFTIDSLNQNSIVGRRGSD